MKALIAIKRVIDPYVNIRIRSDNSSVETANVKMAMNPFDEIAIEEAVRLKEKSLLSEIIVVSIGNQDCQETLRQGLARGADRALLIKTEKNLFPLSIAKVLCKIVMQHNVDLVLLGKQAIDNDCNQTGQMLAALLNWPQATFASKIVLDINNKSATITREVDGGLETLAVSLPSVITTDLRLNEPRYISLPNVMQAKKKPLEQLSLEKLGLNLDDHLNVLSVESPQARKSGTKVENVAELIEKLKHEAKVI